MMFSDAEINGGKGLKGKETHSKSMRSVVNGIKHANTSVRPLKGVK